MSDNQKEVPFEILPNGQTCLIMPARVDEPVARMVFMPKVRIVSSFEFADTEAGCAHKAFSIKDRME